MPKIIALLTSLIFFSTSCFAGVPKKVFPEAAVEALKRETAYKTIGAWAKDYTKQMTVSDRTFLLGKIAGSERAAMPRATIKGGTLKIAAGGKFVNVTAVDLHKGIYKIGAELFTFDRRKGFKEQFRILEPLFNAAVQEEKSAAADLKSWLLPQAQADVIVVVLGIIAVQIVIAGIGLTIAAGEAVGETAHDATHGEQIARATAELTRVTGLCKAELSTMQKGSNQTADSQRLLKSIKSYHDGANAFGDCAEWRGLGASPGERQVCKGIDELTTCLERLHEKTKNGFAISAGFIKDFDGFMMLAKPLPNDQVPANYDYATPVAPAGK